MDPACFARSARSHRSPSPQPFYFSRPTPIIDLRTTMQEPTTSLYEQERRQKLQKLRDANIDPFGQRTPGLQPLAEIKALYKPEMGHDAGPVVKAAGRIHLKRDMGKKLSFITLRDETGDLQI